MKKVKMFGKMIPVFVLVLLGIGMVSAALVTYLSNQVEADITVESPMEQGIKKLWTDTYSAGPLSFTSFGGETTTFYVKTENKADVAITGNVNNIITNPIGVTCADFESVNVRTTKDGGTTWDGPYDLIGLSLCTDTSWNTVTFSYGPTPITWAAGQIDQTEIVTTFKTNAVGTYTFTSKVVPTP